MADWDLQLEGVEELDRILATLPQRMAEDLVKVAKTNFLDHVQEMVRSSDFDAGSKRNFRRTWTVYPRKRVQPKRIEDVKAGEFTSWKGEGVDSAQSPQAASRVTEERLGRSVVRPVESRMLAIPAGFLRTKTGRVKTRAEGDGRARRTVAEQKNTFLVRRGRSFLVIQRVQKGRESRRARRGVATVVPVQEETQRLVGILTPSVRVRAKYDYFGSWRRLKSKRDDRYRRLMDKAERYWRTGR